MATNKLPTNPGQLIGLATKMGVGLGKTGPSIPVTMTTQAQMEANLAAYVTADDKFNIARSFAQSASDGYQATLLAIYTWLVGVRSMLIPTLGTRWSTAWAQAGFTNHTTAVPTRIEDRIALVISLEAFFTDQPQYEVKSLKATAADGKALRVAAGAAQGGVADAEMALKDKGDIRDAAEVVLVGGMRDLISNLDRKLDPMDPRWLAFGLNQPGVSQTPGKPVNVVCRWDEMGGIITTCDAVPLATRYRWRMLLVGVQGDYILAASSVDPMGLIKDVMPGQRVLIIVQAVNGSLQGVASDAVAFTVPLAVNATSAESKSSDEPALSSGSAIRSNGRTNGNRLPALA